MKTIGIFPASGGLATSTITHLLTTCAVPSSSLILISRHPSKTPASIASQPGLVLRTATYESTQQELEAAFKGVDVLFLISYPSFKHELRSAVQLPALSAAHAAGVRHVFYSSLLCAKPPAQGHGSGGEQAPSQARGVVMRAHLDSEAHLRELGGVDSGFTWTSIREGLYYETLGMYTAFWDPTKPSSSSPSEILIPHDGSGPGASWVKRDDLGEASARLIAQYATSPSTFKYKDAIVSLSGPRSWTMAETIAVLGKVGGHEGRIKQVSVDEYARQKQVLGVFGDEESGKQWATVFDAIRAGETEYVSGTLEELLGRKPAEMEDTLREIMKG